MCINGLVTQLSFGWTIIFFFFHSSTRLFCLKKLPISEGNYGTCKKERWGGWGGRGKKVKKKLKWESLACIQASLPGPLFLTSVINGKAPTWYIYIYKYVCMYEGCKLTHFALCCVSSIHPSIHPSMILALQSPDLLNTGGFGRWIWSQ